MKNFTHMAMPLLAIAVMACNQPHPKPAIIVKPVAIQKKDSTELNRLARFAAEAKFFTAGNEFDTGICFLLDMSLNSGQNRFFIYDLAKSAVLSSGLVAHGDCNSDYLPKVRFSNELGCGCSSKGKYKIGSKYNGSYGLAYKLYGLDSTNSNAFERSIVLHGFDWVPDKETRPDSMWNSSGCPMVSRNFLKKLSVLIDETKKPVLLWMFD